MPTPRKCTAIKASASLALLFIASVAGAESIGTVTDLDGTLLATRTNGSIKVLALSSEIEQGDLLSSRNQTYVTLSLADDSTVTLGPDTDLKIERFVFHKHVPDNDGAEFALARGRVRITAGLLGKRAEDTLTLATPLATLDIRGASLLAEYVAPDQVKVASRDTILRDSGLARMVAVSYTPAANAEFVSAASHSNTLHLAQMMPPSGPRAGALPAGLYVQVLDGAIQLSNSGGTQSFSAGQFGYTASLVQPPVIVPANPGMQFTPPPTFSSPAPTQGTSAASKPGAVDCQVR